MLKGRFGRDSVALVLAITLLRSLHPIQTASVTYIVQRAESLAGLFYLLSLYLFVRGLEPNANEVLGVSPFFLLFDYPSKKDKKKGLTPKPPKVNTVIKDITLRHG